MDAADARTGAASRDVMDDLGGDGIGIGIAVLRAAVRRAALFVPVGKTLFMSSGGQKCTPEYIFVLRRT